MVKIAYSEEVSMEVLDTSVLKSRGCLHKPFLEECTLSKIGTPELRQRMQLI